MWILVLVHSGVWKDLSTGFNFFLVFCVICTYLFDLRLDRDRTLLPLILSKSHIYFMFFIPGVIVAGGPGTGKSSCIQVLVDALSAMVPAVSRQQSRNSVSSITAISHKLQRINPLVVDDLNLMFGQVNQNQEFVDGVFTNIWRKANRVNGIVLNKWLFEIVKILWVPGFKNDKTWLSRLCSYISFFIRSKLFSISICVASYLCFQSFYFIYFIIYVS